MRIKEPKTTALIFASGKMVCTGARSEEDSRKAARQYAKIIQKLGYEIEVIGNGTEYYKECGVEEKEIDFIINVDTAEKEIWIDDFHLITMQELQAINKKCKELGWI